MGRGFNLLPNTCELCKKHSQAMVFFIGLYVHSFCYFSYFIGIQLFSNGGAAAFGVFGAASFCVQRTYCTPWLRSICFCFSSRMLLVVLLFVFSVLISPRILRSRILRSEALILGWSSYCWSRDLAIHNAISAN
jgi:hypothetical protein